MTAHNKTETSSPLIGTWQLISWTVRKADGRITSPFGHDLDGYIGYTIDGRMSAFMRLQTRTVFYAGFYDVEGDRVTHHVTVADRLSTEGTDLVRTFKIEGNRVALTTVEPPPRRLVPDTAAGDTSTLVWQLVS